MPAASSSSKWEIFIESYPTLAQTEGGAFLYSIRAIPPANAGNSSVDINWTVEGGLDGDFSYRSGTLRFGPGLLQRYLAVQSQDNNVDDGLGPERPFTVTITAADPSKVDVFNGIAISAIIDDEYCLLAGTLIATPSGEVPIESLRIGDLVKTADGAPVPIKWIGRQSIPLRQARQADRLPICVRSGALGAGLPRRDLYTSPDHALFIDGVLVHASALENGRSIVAAENLSLKTIEYYHIEAEGHELIVAEGVAVETFIDNEPRQKFDNYAEYELLYPNPSMMQPLNLPRVKYARQLPACINQRLLARAAELPALPQLVSS
jgi:hypothetical protein